MITEELEVLEGAIDWYSFPHRKLSDSLALRYKDRLNPECLIEHSHVSVDVLIKVLKSYRKKHGKSSQRFKLSDFSNYGASDLEKIIDSGVCEVYSTDTDIGKLEISDSIVEKYNDKLPSVRYMVSDYCKANLSYSSICKLTRDEIDKLHYTKFASVMSDHGLLLELFDVIWTNSLLRLDTDNEELRGKISGYRERFGDSIVYIDKLYRMFVTRSYEEYGRYGHNLFNACGLDVKLFKDIEFPLYVIKYLIHNYGVYITTRLDIRHIDVVGLADYDFALNVRVCSLGNRDVKESDVVKYTKSLKNHVMYLYNKYGASKFDPEIIKLYDCISDEACLSWFKEMSADTLLEHWDLFDNGTYQPSTSRCGIYLFAHRGEDIDSRILDRLYDKNDVRNRWGCDYSYCLSSGDLMKYRDKVDWKHIIRYRELSDSDILEYMKELRHIFNSEERWKLGHDLKRDIQPIFDANCKKFDLYTMADKKVNLSVSIPRVMNDDQVKEYLFNQYKAQGK